METTLLGNTVATMRKKETLISLFPLGYSILLFYLRIGTIKKPTSPIFYYFMPFLLHSNTHILLFILFVLTLLLLRAFSGYVYKCVQRNNNMLAHETMCGILLLTRMIKQRNCRHKPNTPSYRAHKKQYNESTCNSQVTRFVVYRFVEVCVCVRACAWNCPISYAECIPRRTENKW